MATPLTTYCSLDFLLSFYKGKPDEDPFSHTKDHDLWHDVRRFLLDHTRVVVDATIDEVKVRAPSLLDLIAPGRYRNFSFDPERFQGVGESAFHARCARGTVFLVEGVDHARLSARFGALFLSFADLYDAWRRIGRQRTLNVEPGCKTGCLKSMSDLRFYSSPTTTLVISDPYLIAELKKTKTFEENLGSLLLALLPEGPNEIVVHVAIVSNLYDARDGLLMKPDEAKGRIERFLSLHRPDLTVEVGVVQPHKIPHDRRVFTDYGFFSSHYGWTLFGKDGNAIKETTLQYAPAFDADLREISSKKLLLVFDAISQPSIAFDAGKPIKLTAGNAKAAFQEL